MLRKTVADLLDSSVRSFHISCLERRLSNDQSVDDNSKRPDIDLVRVPTLSLQNLRGNIIRSTANRSLLLSVEIEFRCKTKITELYLHLVVQEEISKLKISMNDPMRVQILEGLNDLESVALDFKLMKSLTSLEELIHTLILAQF